MPTGITKLYTTFEEEARKSAKTGWDKELADNDTFYATQADSINKLYDAKVNKQSKAYEDSYRENAIQKLINERQVAENMANLGLTNSGLNRTQQTAVQLSYANNKAGIDRQKQSAIDDLNLARTQSLDTNEQNKLSGRNTINQTYEKAINNTAQTNYNNYLTYLAELEKAENERIAQLEEQQRQNSYIIKTNNGLLSRDFEGSLKDNGVDSYKITKDYVDYIRYVDNNSGKSVELPVGVNPYTGDDNSALEAIYGVFDNGYQPKGVEGYGAFDKTKNGYVKAVGTAQFKGRNQNVFSITKNGATTYWIWDGANNEYFQVKNEGKDAKGNTIWNEV